VGCKYAESVTDWKTYYSLSLGKLPPGHSRYREDLRAHFEHFGPVVEVIRSWMTPNAFEKKDPRGGARVLELSSSRPPADLLSQSPGKNASNSVISLNRIILISSQ
jgi:hypothetical protein